MFLCLPNQTQWPRRVNLPRAIFRKNETVCGIPQFVRRLLRAFSPDELRRPTQLPHVVCVLRANSRHRRAVAAVLIGVRILTLRAGELVQDPADCGEAISDARAMRQAPAW